MNTHHHRIRAAAALALAIALAAGPAVAEGQKKASRRAPHLQVQEAPSHETPARRDQRLHRECKGRPNAGACLGYAS